VTSTTTGLPDRYRPITQVAPDEETETGVIRSWRARDRVLNRDVALRVHTPGGPAARQWITRALTAGGLATPALSMVYDAAEGTGGNGPGGAAYVVNEWLEGQTLRDRLAEGGPLPEREARALVRRLGEGVAEAHRVGLAVGGLTPEHVVLRPGGLAGLLSVPAATGTVQGDIEALGTLLELALTGRTTDDGDPADIASPDLAALVRRARSTDPATRLSSAAALVTLLADRPRTGPQESGRPDGLTDSGWMRRLRDRRESTDAEDDEATADAGPATSAIDQRAVRLDRGALPPVPEASGARPRRAGSWPVADDEEPLDWSAFADVDAAAVEDAAPSARRRLALVGLPLLALVVVIAFAVWFGKNVLSVAGSVDEVPAGPPPSAPASSAAAAPATPPPATTPPPAIAAGAPLPIAGASVFDPFGDGAPENDRKVPLSHDGNPATSWSTVSYRGSAQFGGLKPGVGVLYDLGSPHPLAGVSVTTTLPGTTVQLRTGDNPGAGLDGFQVAAGGQLTGTTQLSFPAPVTSRYVLVWVTGLVDTGDGYTGDLAEVTPLAAG
jgi:eukaryotic-like serine/threonine-protein kinase